MKITIRHAVSIAIFCCTVLFPAKIYAQTFGQVPVPLPSVGVNPEVGVVPAPSTVPAPQQPSELTQQPGSVPTSAPLVPPPPIEGAPNTTSAMPGTPPTVPSGSR